MKALEEIMSQPPAIKTGVDLKDSYGMSRLATIASGMTIADFSGIGNEDEYIPGLGAN